MHKTVVVFLLDQPNLSVVELNIGSNNPSAEVIPANRMDKKSNGANIWPIKPMTLKILGKTMNINPVPSVISCIIGVPLVNDIYPKIAYTPNAVHTSKAELDNTTKITLSTNFEFSGR